MQILVLDHRDSFVWNVVQGLELGAREAGLRVQVTVTRPQPGTEARLREPPPDGLVLGPGPGGPLSDQAEPARSLAHAPPERCHLLGVCLGHQIVAAAHGARVQQGSRPVHGHDDLVEHDGRGLFRDLPTPLTVGRYHSLEVDPASLPKELEVTARTNSGTVMGLRHRTARIESVQFHPDSVLSAEGPKLFANFLRQIADGH
ncbi:MAG: anthranilate synthase component II [Planctomycetota bacterium]